MVTEERTDERTIGELLAACKGLGLADELIGEACEVSGVTVWRWRQGQRGIARPKMVRRALLELLEERGHQFLKAAGHDS